MLLKIRPAQLNDRNDVLKFCVNTFDWGDYIDRVWNSWYSDSNGRLIIAEYEPDWYTVESNTGIKSSAIVAVSHVYLCPNRKVIWLEGIRIRSDYRRRHIATELIRKMLEYGIEQNAKESAAIVSTNNVPSQLLMQRNGFTKISKWNYFSGYVTRNDSSTNGYKVKVAIWDDIDSIFKYLKSSEIFKISGESYVDMWRWYTLDPTSLFHLITNKSVLVVENSDYSIAGIAIINKDYDKQLQILYLDTNINHLSVLKHLILYAINLDCLKIKENERLQIFSPQVPYVNIVMKCLGINQCEEFLLYKRKI
ncbi:MAG TPA: GNAT family N-acetyltransferase [Nitrososphaeraceae archaeon]